MIGRRKLPPDIPVSIDEKYVASISQAPPPAAPMTVAATTDITDQLSQLAALRETGMLTAEEFDYGQGEDAGPGRGCRSRGCRSSDRQRGRPGPRAHCIAERRAILDRAQTVDSLPDSRSRVLRPARPGRPRAVVIPSLVPSGRTEATGRPPNRTFLSANRTPSTARGRYGQAWGTGGRGFESRRPDQTTSAKPAFGPVFVCPPVSIAFASGRKPIARTRASDHASLRTKRPRTSNIKDIHSETPRAAGERLEAAAVCAVR